MIFDPFLTLGYVGKVKVFFHPINAVPYWTGRGYHFKMFLLFEFFCGTPSFMLNS